jgi:zinc protease
MNEVAALTQQDAFDWYKRWYGPENALLVVAGDISAAELKPLAEEIYGKIPRRGDLRTRSWPEVRPLAKSLSLSHSDPKVRQPDWTRYWLGVPIGDPDSEALRVGLEILGGGRTSRLYRDLVENGVAVMTYAYSDELEAKGLLAVSASPTPGKTVEDVKRATLAVVDKYLKEGPTQDELDRAKKRIAATAIFARDNQQGMANWYGSQMIAGQTVEEVEGWDDRIKAVTLDQVNAALRKYLVGVNHVDAVLLPEKE